MAPRPFENVITTTEQLREIIRPPRPIVADKAIDHIDRHCRSFVERSPFVVVASSDGSGNVDLSPKGDPAGFVQILDPRTLAIPERPGNHRADTFTNVLQYPYVGLFFLVPGVKTTLRVSGQARIVADADLLETMTVTLPGKPESKPPKLALVVDVAEAMLHCAKCVIRSNLWEPEGHDHDVSDLADAMVDMAKLEFSADEMREIIEKDQELNLY